MTKINKEGWEIKKLGEVATFLGGGTPSKKNEAYYTGDIPWATVRDMVSFELAETEYHITPEAVDESATNIIPKGTIVISTHVGLGKICVLMQDTAINQDLKAVIFNSEETLIKGYFAYWYKSIADFIVSNGKGATVKGVTLDFMRNLPIPLPPLPIQQHIVEELDEINAIISAKKQQLSKLDELAQSIFYNMFGDPVANEKGWEVKTFKQCFSLKSGDGLSAKNFVDGQYPVYGGNGIAGYHNAFNKEGQNIIIGRVGALCGNVHLVEGQIFVTDNAFVLSTNENFEATTLLYLLRFLNLRQFARDALQPVISNTSLKDIKVILPPLSLQEAFATRVSAIEDQKAAIAASIEKMQTLLDARMQEYFG